MEIKKPLVSIITVSYNSAKTISDTIESVLNQTYEYIEYIIIDGLSKDNTIEIAQRYEKEFSEKNYSYKILSEKDNGIYDAMNKGIRIASGKIIGMINSDDWYEKTAIERVVDTYIMSNFDMFYADLRLIKGNKSSIKKARIRKFATSRDWNHPTTFILKDLYLKYQYNVNLLYSDFDLWLKIRKNGYKIVILNEVLANYRLGGISNQKSLDKAINRIVERYMIYKENEYSKFYLIECIAIESVKLLMS